MPLSGNPAITMLRSPWSLINARYVGSTSDAVEFWDLVNRQDWSICERVQQGLRARVHRSGYYAPMEDFNLDIRRYVSERIGSYLPGSLTP